jgi:nitrogen fixation/metabolism regulation signal transduction histidine kinase
MRQKYFRIYVVLHILSLLALGYASFYILTQTHFWLVSLWVLLAFFILLFNLVRYVERSKRELAYFLLSIKQHDFSNHFPYQNKEELNYAFHQINQVMKELSNEKASNHLYLHTLVEHVSVAVICFNEDNKVQLLNKAAKVLFQKEYLSSLNALGLISPEISSLIYETKGNGKKLIKVNIGGQLLNLSILITTFKLQEKSFKLVSFQDIKTELESQEMDSWQRLIRVLTHEINNSVIPISTLSEVTLQMYQKELLETSRVHSEADEDIMEGLATIGARSKGLARFVNTYDQLTKMPKPHFESMNITTLVQRLIVLFKSDFERLDIQLNTQIKKDIIIKADPDLIDQVLINLLKNAMDAIKTQKIRRIEISIDQTKNSVDLIVADNGPSIPAEVLDNIFVPFYTTKQGGSGIGLSISRQIMKLHNGSLSVASIPNRGTKFKVSF